MGLLRHHLHSCDDTACRAVRELFRIYLFERSRLAELLVPELPDTWRSWVHEQLQG
jgi:hypothetical protein